MKKSLSPILWVAFWVSGLIGVATLYPQEHSRPAHLPTPAAFLTKIPNSKTISSLAEPTTPTTPVPSLTITSLVSFVYEVGANFPASQTIDVGTTSPGAISGQNILFSATQSNDSWLNLQQTSTMTPGQVVVSITPSGLDIGQYQGEIAVLSDQADNSPQYLRVRLLVNPGSISVSPSTLQFNYSQGSGAPPASQSVAVMGNLPTTYTATASSEGNWLSLTNASGPTPANLGVALNPIKLLPGNYSGQINILGATSTSPVTVSVNLSVTAARAPSLMVSPSSLSVSLAQGDPISMQQLTIANTGGGVLSYSAQVVPVNGGKWLSLPQSSGTASSTVPGILQLAIDPSNLMSGVYSSVVNVSSTNGGLPFSVNVILSISANTKSLVLSQAGLQFTGVQNGEPPLSQSFAILNAGRGAMSWRTAATALTAGQAWLTVDQASGSSEADSIGPPVVRVNVNQAGVTPGSYYGSIQISAPDAANSLQTVSVRLDVLPPFQSPGATLSTSGIILFGKAGDPSPQPHVFTLYNTGSRAANFTSIARMDEGGDWFKQSPSGGTLPPGGSAQIALQPNFASLTPGIRKGLVNVTLGDGIIHSVSVLSIVAAASETSCQPSTSAVQITSPEPNFVATAGKSIPVSVLITDNCNNLLADQSRTFAVATMPDSRNLQLVSQGNGLWTGTWSPSSQADVAVVAVSSGTLFSGSTVPVPATAMENGIVRNSSLNVAPIHMAIYNAASMQTGNQIALGSQVKIRGFQFAVKPHTALNGRIPSEMAKTQVFLGGVRLPLSEVSPTVITAVVPYGLTANTQQQLIVVRDGTQSVGMPVTVAEVQPGIYTTNQEGTGQARVLIAGQKALAAPTGTFPGSRPAARGEFIEIYATGLGGVNNPTIDGAPAPSKGSLATSMIMPSVTIGDVAATVQFAGLAPGLIGVFQVNVQVPAGAPVGDAVPVVLTVGAIQSNTATIAIQ